MTALVGREEELELLLRRWGKAKAGEGQVVVLAGEAGIGKSRLTAALLDRLAGEPHTRLRYFCSPQHTDSAFHPIIGQLERAAGLAHDDAPQTKLDKLDALLAHTATSREDAALVAELLSLASDGRHPALELDAQQRRQRTLQALAAQVESLARADPVLMIFEDAHWADPTSLEALGRTVERLTTLRVLLIVTYRPEFEAPWIGRPHVTALTLNRLAQREIGALIDRVIGNKRLAAAMRADIIERTDGIPLFVEEMTKAVVEAENEDEARRTAAAVPSHVPAVPPSLHASLMARLDRLGSAKEVAQVGAAIGREFSHALLAAVAPETELASALDRLVAAGLMFRQGVAPHASYLFKHALVQDAAYGTLLREPRRALHARIAEALERDFPDVAERQPELLARHCTEAGLIEKASNLWGKAGERSLERSALMEAIEQIKRAIEQIVTLPSTPTLLNEQIRLQIALVFPLIHIKGYAAPETRTTLDGAHLLIEQMTANGKPPADPLLSFAVLYGRWGVSYVAFDGELLRERASQFLALAKKSNATAPLVVGHRLMGIALCATGNFSESLRHLDRAITLYDPREHRPLAMRFGQDVRVSVLCWRSWTRWFLGFPDAALADSTRAMVEVRELRQAATTMYALTWVGLAETFRGDYVRARALADEQILLADEKGSPFWKGYAIARQGVASFLIGNASDAVETIMAGLTMVRSTGAISTVPFLLSYLAQAYAELGKLDDAWRSIGESVSILTTSKERWGESDTQRIAGEIALLSEKGDCKDAVLHFEQALEIARAQQAKSWELRAATSLARLRRDQGRRDEARDLLAPVYGWFTEGFDTHDLKQAKALLDELG